jgi:hypothetical protein
MLLEILQLVFAESADEWAKMMFVTEKKVSFCPNKGFTPHFYFPDKPYAILHEFGHFIFMPDEYKYLKNYGLELGNIKYITEAETFAHTLAVKFEREVLGIEENPKFLKIDGEAVELKEAAIKNTTSITSYVAEQMESKLSLYNYST